MPKHQAKTDEIKEIKLPSAIQQVMWTKPQVAIGAQVGLEIFTNYVGNASEVEIELSDGTGKKFGTSKAKISNNYLKLQILLVKDFKELLYAKVKLPKHSLDMKSNPLLILPPVEISNAQWDKKEARRGDMLKLTADVKGAREGSEAEIEIWEHDSDEAHDLITKFPVIVKNNKVESEWEYEYYDDTDDIPTEEETEKGYNPPEYFFKVKVNGAEGKSALLEFKDWIEIELTDDDGEPVPNEKYILHLADGSKKEGTLDDTGRITVEDVPPGAYHVEFPDLEIPEEEEFDMDNPEEDEPDMENPDEEE
jgi:hypothetical protein